MQLTVQQAAELLQVDEAQVRRWIRDRGLPAVVFNEQYRLNRIDLLAWAQEHQVPLQAHALPAASPDATSLVAALRRGGIHRDLPGQSRGDVLRELLQRLALPPAVDRELMIEMVLARELRGSTTLGNGIAIPHARYPMLAALPEPLVALGFPAAPIDAGTVGGPIVALFLLLTPDNRTHLQLLSALARALQGGLEAPVLARGPDAAILAAAAAGSGGGGGAAPRSAVP